MRCTKGLILLIFSLLSFTLNAQIDDIQFRQVSPPGGFTYGPVKTIAEDSKGLIWFGTDHGLFQYNTREMKKFIHQQDDPFSIPADNIMNIFNDRSGKLWISTYGGLCTFDEAKQNFTLFKLKETPQIQLNSTIRQILQNKKGDLFSLHSINVCKLNLKDSAYQILPFHFEVRNDHLLVGMFDSSDNLWLGTNYGYVYYSEPPYQNFRVFSHLQTASVRCLLKAKSSLWIGYEWGGVDQVDDQGKLIGHFDQKNIEKNKLPHNRVRQIVQAPDGKIWIATYSGIQIVSDDGTHSVRKNQYNQLPHNSIYSLFVDSRKSIWIGTWSGGLAFHSPYDNQFLHFNKVGTEGSLSSNVVSSFAEEPDGTIWVGTENGILNSFDREEKTFKAFRLQKSSNGTSNIKCMALDKNDKLWLGTLSNGLWYFDKKTQTFRQLDIFDTGIVNLYAILPDENGLWLGTFGTGLFYYDFTTGRKTVYLANGTDPKAISSSQIRVIYKDSRGGLWVGTHIGLNYRAKGETGFIRYFYNDNQGQRISNNEVFAIQEDDSGKIWIGTGGGGIDCYDPTTGKFTNLSPANGLAGFNVYGILKDDNGDLWFSTDNGISCYHLREKTFSNYTQKDGLQGDQFNPGAAFKCRDGSLLFGGPNGFNLFSPNKIVANPAAPKIILTELSINNRKVTIDGPESPLKESLSSVKTLRLKPNQNSLIFEFVANNFIQPQKNQFRYRLVNYENNWQEAGNEGRAIFTKVPPGNYILEVLGSNNDGLWSSKPLRLPVIVLPPFWRTWYAYLLYAILLFTISYFIRKEYLVRKQLKVQLMVERVQRENEEKLHQMKMQFFTNISHDFRTPLTLILSPLEKVLSEERFAPVVTENLTLIHRNAKRLRRLIDQLLDFRKLELNKATFSPAVCDVAELCLDVCKDFVMYARDKSIFFSFESSFSKLKIDLDSDKIDKVLFNLLSNAFKYTPENGAISVQIEEKDGDYYERTYDFATDPLPAGKVIAVRVKDNGPGVPKEEHPLLFERFYQAERKNQPGAGIGLHLCREYVRMHQGTILFSSSPGEGTLVTFLIPAKIANASPASQTEKQVWEVQPSLTDEDESVQEKSRHSILVVEDNREMQKYLRQLLSDEYRVLIAGNGTQGLEIANELFPDLIISDIMMPGIDGFELCQRIKENLNTSHIPVILLTALTDINKQISGLKTGANAYVTKPFDNKLLKAQVSNLLTAQKRMQQAFIESQEKWEEDSNLMVPDKRLMEKAIDVIDKHILDVNFSVEQLAAELNMSRSSLHRKLRILANQSANEFIRYIRLKKAIKLMKEGSYNIDEVGYAVGFNSPSYFTKCFKKQFDKTPSAFMNELKQEKN